MTATQAQAKAAAPAATPAATVSVAVTPTKAARYPEAHVITVLDKGKANPKRAASAKRYALYLATPDLTVGAYLDGCLALQPDEPRYRWRADLDWDVKRGFIAVSAPSA